MSTLFEIAIVLAAIWFTFWFVRKAFRITIQEEATHGSEGGGADPAKVPSRLRPRPTSGAAAAKVEDPDEEFEFIRTAR